MPQQQKQDAVNLYFESTAEFWRDVYGQADLAGQIYRDRLRAVLRMVDHLALPSGAHLLDAGCGAGGLTVALAAKGYTVDAIDAVEKMVDLTDELAAESGLGHRVCARVGDIRQMDYPDGEFVFAVTVGVLPWLPSLDRPLDELVRVTSVGGHVIVTADNVCRISHLLDPVALFRYMGGAAIRRVGLRSKRAAARRHTPRAVDSALIKAGLEKREYRTVGFGPFSFANRNFLSTATGLRVDAKLQGYADRGVPLIRSLGSHYIVLARKPAAQS